MSSNGPLCLVGDIGGTNARFAVAETAGAAISLRDPQSFRCADIGSATEAIERYLQITRQARPPIAVIAIAGPVENGAAVSTNGLWSLSEEGLEAHGFRTARVINDYSALALSASRLDPEHLAALGPDLNVAANRTIAVVGAGTGFGVGALTRDNFGATPVATEGGHVAFAPADDVEIEILKLLRERFGRVSIERILSGAGLSNLHWALARIDGRNAEALTASEVVTRAKSGEDRLCAETLTRFCAIYGSVAGDFALAFGAQGGVLIGGGIAPRIVEYLQASPFRTRFEDKGRFGAYLGRIPTRVVLHPYAALIGAAAALSAGASPDPAIKVTP